MKTFVNKLRSTTKGRAEHGLTLLEVILYISVLGVLVAGAVSLISNVTDSTARFSTTTATQSDVNRAQAVIQRDIGLANEIVNAGGTHIQFNTKQNNSKFLVTIFSYGGEGKFNSLPEYIKDIINSENLTEQLPDNAAVVEIRKNLDSGETGLDALTKGYDPLGYTDGENASSGKHLFSYYNDKNVLLALNEDANFEDDKSPKDIRRVEFRIAADAPGRASKIQAESSVSPLLDKVTPAVNSDSTEPNAPLVCPPNFGAQIAVGDRHAVITWNQVQNATSYIIKRYNTSSGVKVYESEIYIADPSQTSYTEAPNTLDWGANYIYTITANGSGTTLEECSETPPTWVVPDAVDFRNINPHANLGVNKSGAGLETLTGTNVANVTRTANTQKVGANLRYTVARDLTNQLAWEGVFGADQYDIYRVSGGSRTLAASVPATSANRSYTWQETRAYGDSVTYVINARNNAGNSRNTDSVQLFSPPNGSSVYTATPLDPNTALSQNRLNLTKAAPNTVGYRAYAGTTFEASCTTNGTEVRTPGLEFSQATGFFNSTKAITHNKVQWGTSTCYKLVPFNDAGSYNANSAAKVKADQAPKRFSVSKVTSSLYYALDYKRALPSSASTGRATCWVAPDGTTSGHQCNVSKPMSNTNRYPVGSIEPIPNGLGSGQYGQPLRTSVRWGSSEGAKAGYTVKRVVSDQGNGSISGYPTNNSTNLAYANSSGVAVNGVQFNNEKPGTRFDITVSAKAKNGKTRTPSNSNGAFNSTGADSTRVAFSSTKTFSMQTRPDMPGYQAGNYQQRTAYPISRFKYQANGPAYGKSTNIFVQSRVRNDSDVWCSNIATQGSVAENWFAGSGGTHYSNGQNIGCNYRTAINFYNTAHSGSLSSVATSKVGRLYVGSCYSAYSPCGAGFSNYYDEYPNYWAGMHTRAYASAGLNQTSYKWSAGTLVSGQKVPTSKNPSLGGIETGNTRACNTISEAEAGFTTTYNCKYGQGIPPVPSNFTYKANGGTSFTVTWNAVTAAKNYILTIDNGSSTTTTTVTSNSHTLTIPSGQTYRVNVKAVNAAKTGPASGDLIITSTYKPAAVTNLQATPITNSNSFNVTWNALSGATGYKVTVNDGKNKTSATVTTPKYTLKGAYGVTYTITVEAMEGSLLGHPAQVLATGEYELEGPVGFEAEMQESSNKYNLLWEPVVGASKYVIRVFDGETTQLTKDVTGITSTLDVPYNSNYNAVVYAVVNGEETPESDTVSVPGLYAPSPKNFTSTPQSDGIKYDLKWDAVPGVDEYELTFYDIDGNVALTENTTTLKATVQAPAAGEFKVTVRGVKNSILGAESTNVTIEGSDIEALSVDLAREDNSNKYVLTWSAVEEAEGYGLNIVDSNGNVIVDTQLSDSEEQYEFTVPNGEFWTVKMYAIVDGEKGAESEEMTAVGSYLPAPGNLKVVRTAGTINYVATWTSPLAGNSDVSYHVSLTDENGEELSSYNTSALTATVSVPTSAKYYVNVTTLYSGTDGGTSTVEVQALDIMPAPTNVTAVINGTNVDLEGTPSSGAKIFFRVVSEDGDTIYETASETGATTNKESVPLSLFEGGVQYTLLAYSVTPQGSLSLPTEVPVNLGKLGTPMNLTVVETFQYEDPFSYIIGEWIPVANATSYKVVLKNEAGDVIYTNDFSSPNATILSDDLTSTDIYGQTLTMSVVAQSTNASVISSNPAYGTVEMPNGLNGLQLAQNYDVTGKYPLTWNAVEGADNYSVTISRLAGPGCTSLSQVFTVTGTVLNNYTFVAGCKYEINVKPNNGLSSSIFETIEATTSSYTYATSNLSAPLQDNQTATLNLEGFVGQIATTRIDPSTNQIVYGTPSVYTTKTNNPTFEVDNPDDYGWVTVIVNGKFDRGTTTASTNRQNIASVTLGKDSTTDISYLFDGYSTLDYVSLGKDKKLTGMKYAFRNAAMFNHVPAGETWDVSGVTDFTGTFQNATSFNNSLVSSWDTSSATNMTNIFFGASSFNQNIGGWNVGNVVNMTAMFNGATAFNNGNSSTIGTWNVSNVSNMANMFKSAESFNQNINTWNTGSVTNMNYVFQSASAFNSNLSSWNMSNVTAMSGMFLSATSFNNGGSTGINNWNISKVTNTSSVFSGAKAFNQPLNNWDMSNVTNVSGMFNTAENFNQPLTNWKMSNVTNATSMFFNATRFNSNISTWDVSKVTTMASMFYGAKAFNQPLSTWSGKLTKVTNISNMFNGASTFNQNLSSWNFTASSFNSTGYKTSATNWVNTTQFPKRNGVTIP